MCLAHSACKLVSYSTLEPYLQGLSPPPLPNVALKCKIELRERTSTFTMHAFWIAEFKKHWFKLNVHFKRIYPHFLSNVHRTTLALHVYKFFPPSALRRREIFSCSHKIDPFLRYIRHMASAPVLVFLLALENNSFCIFVMIQGLT